MIGESVNFIKYVLVTLVETLLRAAPFPCKTGLVKIGRPDRNSPVFLTCNYHLTVERVKRALRGIDCYLLVASSRGYNVWCGATGGHFTNHSVISVLKTGRIEEFVDHRQVILPQLAAAGIEAEVIRQKTGWKVIWGPVYAADIPAFLTRRFAKTPEMREVRFPLGQRIEMAAMWAFPFSLITAIVLLPFWPAMLLPMTFFFWVVSLSIFIGFPLYSRWLNPEKRGIRYSRYAIIFDFGRVPLLLWGAFILLLLLYSLLAGTFTIGFVSEWSFISLCVILILSMDLMGSTPLYKSGLHKERFLTVFLDEKKCKGDGSCERVCPRNCYELDRVRQIATMPRASRCVQCGACIIQCPFDALYFKSPGGDIIPPEAIRTFKLNLMGNRLVKAEEKNDRAVQ